MSTDTKPYPLLKCTPEEFQENRNLGAQRQAIDQTKAIAIDAVLNKHAMTLCVLQHMGDKMWAVLKKKYSLDPTKDYGIRLIDGHPYICEIPKGEPRQQ